MDYRPSSVVSMAQFDLSCLILFIAAIHYTACTPVTEDVYSQGDDETLRVHIVPAPWSEAALLCQLEGGMLASPTSEALALAMVDGMSELKLTSVFTGMTSMLSKEFRSLEGVNLANVSLEWAANEPDNKNNEEDCLAMTAQGKLADVSCHGVRPYFCRKEIPHNSELRALTPTCAVDGYRLEPLSGSCYKFHKTATPWLKALVTCQSEGGHLAVINSHLEAKILSELFPSNRSAVTVTNFFSNQIRKNSYASVGFMKFDSQWITIHGNTLSEAGFEDWSSGEPNNFGGTEVCGNIDQDGLLNDEMCQKPQPFICEKSTYSGNAPN